MSDSTSTTTPPTSPSDPPRLALRPKEMALALGIGETLLWSLTNQGLIPHVKLGKCIVYPVDAVRSELTEKALKGVRR